MTRSSQPDATLSAESARRRQGDEKSRSRSSVQPPDSGVTAQSPTPADSESLASLHLDDLEADPPPTLLGGADKFQVIRVLGEGGMGTVHLVFDRDLGRHLALKMLRRQTRDQQDRFIEEAQVIGQLQHPNIVPVHEIGITDHGRLYYTMPLVRGTTLRDILDALRGEAPVETGAYTLTRRIQIFVQIVQAVAHAHERGVIHRDLKPSNVMLGAHGEVQVLDWGLAKVMTESRLSIRTHETPAGHIVGTPGYMPPEQARGLDVDQTADVYALGAILYELLTLEHLYEGTALDILTRLALDDPIPPSQRAPEREIPPKLERVCVAALDRRPEHRTQSVAELHARVESWLEVETDRARRRARALERALDGQRMLESYRELKAVEKRLEADLERAAAALDSWERDDGRQRLELERAVDTTRDDLTRASSQVVTTLTEALGLDGDNRLAQELLADYYWDQLCEVEATGDQRSTRFFHDLVSRYHGGKYERELRGDGELTLDSNPPGATVWLHRLVEHDYTLVADEGVPLGTTPLTPVPLPMGSYLVVLRAEGYRDAPYPVCITRNRSWSGVVRMYTALEIGDGFVAVPGGPFTVGGDRKVPDWSLPRHEATIDDFFIGKYPVTMQEYLEFLNDVAVTDPELAVERSPRRPSNGETYLNVTAAGRLELPAVDLEGDRWEPTFPVLAISWNDADAYCRWRSERDGLAYRLPLEEEWEKAARGVDGRDFPWGNRFDAALCNVRSSRRRPAPTTIHEHSQDVSIYGVHGLAGNARDWTASKFDGTEGDELRYVLRGGAWLWNPLHSRCAIRTGGNPRFPADINGFRLARTPPQLD